jgi:hypothetical protein
MENTKKQTAVDWIIKQLEKQKQILKNHFEEGKWNEDRRSEIDNCILICEQAKQMEKEQIIDTFKYAQVLLSMDDKTRAEQHYNETYNNESDGK